MPFKDANNNNFGLWCQILRIFLHKNLVFFKSWVGLRTAWIFTYAKDSQSFSIAKQIPTCGLSTNYFFLLDELSKYFYSISFTPNQSAY